MIAVRAARMADLPDLMKLCGPSGIPVVDGAIGPARSASSFGEVMANCSLCRARIVAGVRPFRRSESTVVSFRMHAACTSPAASAAATLQSPPTWASCVSGIGM